MNARRLAPGLSTRTRRRSALIAALTLPLSLMSAPAIAQGPTPPPATASETTAGTTEPTLKAAWDQAAKTGKPVEVPTHSTETMKVWANPDGKNMRAELHTRPVQLKNAASGTWEPIDTRIVTRDGKLQATRVKTPLTFGGRGAKQLVSAPGKHGEIGLGVTRALPEPKVSGNAVTYPDAVAPGADLVVLAQADGFISQVVFRQRPAGPVTVRLPLTLPEGTTFGKTSQGLPQLKDAKGKAKAAPIVLTATDAKVEAALDQGRTHSVKAQVETTGKTSELVFTPDENFLADPAVTYPVTVAASSTWFGGGAPDDAWISKNDPYNNNSAAGYLRAGTTSTSADIARVYLKFNTSDPVLKGATVNDADLRIWNYKSGGPNGQLCGETMGAGIQAARVTSAWNLNGTVDSLDWYNQPSSTAPETVNRAGYNYDADPATWCAKDEELFYEVTAMTRAWIQQGEANHGIVLKAASETAAINWRQYYSSQFGGGSPYPGYRHPPALIITYTPAPTHPEGHTLLSDSPIDMDTLTDAEANAMVTQVSTVSPEVPATTTEESSAVRAEAESPFNVLPEGSLPLDEETWEDMDPTPGQPPTVTQQIPGKDATEVNPGTLIAVQFDEPVTDTQISVKDSSGTAVAGTMSADPQATLATFTPAQRLAENMAYTVEVTGATDVAGSTMAPYSWTFTTGGADTTAPSVAGTDPADQATNVPLNTEIKVTFNEAVSEVQITVKDASDTPVQGTVAGGPSRWTFKPASPLAASKAHRVDVSGAKDASGNVMAPYTWSFTTGADTPPPVPGLVAAYGMNEGSGTSVADSSGQNNPGTGSSTAWANGKYGKALSFDGSSSMVTVAHAASLRLTTGMTLSAWVNPTTVTGTAWRSVVTKELSSNGASYALYAANGGTVPSGWVQTDPDTSATADGLSPLPVNSWSHLALTYDGAALRLFVNGQQINQTSLGGSLYDDGNPLRIGGNVAWNEYFSGLIDEVRIYNRAQTAAEIQTDMTTPIGQAAPPDTQAPTAPGSLAATGGSGGAQLTWTASTDNVGVTGYRIHRFTTPGFTPSAANQVGSVTASTFTDGGLAAGTYYYQVLATDAAGNLSPSSNEVSAAVTAPPATPGLVAAYGMNEGSGSIVGDSSGQHNTGAASDTTWANGKHGKALSFNGASSWVTVPHAQSLRLANTLTLSAWVRPAAVDAWHTVLMKENASGPAYGLYASYGGVPLGWLSNATTFKSVVGDDPLPINEWSHLAVTYNGTIITLYLNGTQIDQTPMTGNLADDGGVLRLGGNNIWLDEFYSGLIDEVRIYNRVQTAAEIQADMNAPIGAAATSTATQQQRLNAATDPAPAIDRLTVDGGRTVDGATLASTLTPRLTTWLSAGREGDAKVEVEIAGKPTKSAKAGEARTDRRLIWSGEVTAKPGDTRVSLQVPEGKLRDGEKARWRARIVTDQQTEAGGWTAWSQLAVTTAASQEPAKTSAAIASESAQAMLAPSDFPYDPITFAQCWQNMNRASRVGGYTKNSFNWCGSWYLHQTRERESKIFGFVEVEQNTGVVGYRFSYAIRTAVGNKVADKKGDSDAVKAQKRANAEVGARNIEVWVIIDQVKPFDNLPDSAAMHANGKLTVDFQIKGDPGGSCKPLAGHDNSAVTRTLQNWNNYSHHFRFTSDKLASTGANRVSTCTLIPRLYYEGSLEGEEDGYIYNKRDEVGVIKKSFRCDTSELVLMYYGGCIFPEITPVLGLSTADRLLYKGRMIDNKVKLHAVHIKEAMTSGKRIPGSPDRIAQNPLSPTPLTRAWPGKNAGEVEYENRQVVNRTCTERFGPGWYEANKEHCDEYPFASTLEGAANDNFDFSVKLIPECANCAAGSTQSIFWMRYRVLPGDTFYVKIYDGQPPAQ
uniref:LamG-like jellyroll fold domain-containing protein n=1 Tax=Nonomuraea pusilla TaxID=46177 RepID=UPI0009E8DE2E|nr:LamG-like jellyroll fold domain-containing protein [Nonomuraea pusilla]